MVKKLYLAVNWVNYPQGTLRSQLQHIAAESWSKLKQQHPDIIFVAIGEQIDLNMAPDFMEKAEPLTRNARDVIKYDRHLPFLRDIISRLLEYPDETILSNWYGYLNSDIIFKQNFFELFYKLDGQGFTSIISRADEIKIVASLEDAYKEKPFVLELSGRDLFMFKLQGGIKLLEQLPDYLIGEPAWDLDAYRILMQETNMHDDVDSCALTIHMNHERDWLLNDSIGKNYNNGLYRLKYRLAAGIDADGFYTTYLNRQLKQLM